MIRFWNLEAIPWQNRSALSKNTHHAFSDASFRLNLGLGARLAWYDINQRKVRYS